MSIEKYIEKFEEEFPYVISGKIIDNENGAILFHEKTNLIKSFLRTSLEEYGREELAKHRVVLLDKMEGLMNYAKQNNKDYETVNEAHFAVAQLKECLNNLK